MLYLAQSKAVLPLTPELKQAIDHLSQAQKLIDAHILKTIGSSDPLFVRQELVRRILASDQVDDALRSVKRLDPAWSGETVAGRAIAECL